MKRFAIGLVIGLVGAILWVITSVLWGFGAAFGAEAPPVVTALMIIGFIAMFGGPLVYWVALPIKDKIRRRR